MDVTEKSLVINDVQGHFIEMHWPFITSSFLLEYIHVGALVIDSRFSKTLISLVVILIMFLTGNMFRFVCSSLLGFVLLSRSNYDHRNIQAKRLTRDHDSMQDEKRWTKSVDEQHSSGWMWMFHLQKPEKFFHIFRKWLRMENLTLNDAIVQCVQCETRCAQRWVATTMCTIFFSVEI